MKRVLLVCVVCLVLASVGTCEPVGKKGTAPKGPSDEEHYKEGEHNVKYDHEAFLGKEGAKEFDQLTPEESKRRLGLVIEDLFVAWGL